MATSKIQAPQSAIFSSDPLEQIFARGVLDRDMSGLSYMFLNAAEGRRARAGDQYLTGLDAANQRAQELARLEEAFKFRTTLAEQGTKLALGGYSPTTLSGGPDLFNGNPAAADPVAQLMQEEMRSKINANNARAAGGGGGGEQYTVQTDVMPWEGGQGVTTITGKTKGGDPLQTLQTVRALEEQYKAKTGGKTFTPEQRRAAMEAVARRKYGNIAE